MSLTGDLRGGLSAGRVTRDTHEKGERRFLPQLKRGGPAQPRIMDLTVVQYVGFVITALILIWAVIEINKRLSRRDKSQNETPNNWAELDAKRPEAREELPAKNMHLDEGQTELEGELHARAKQNGHHAPHP